MISREGVLRVLDYDEFSGIFIWKFSNGVHTVGKEAGWVCPSRCGKRYRLISISGTKYKAHRLAWLIINGLFPENEIDHIDGNGLNNKYSNLRAVNRTENARNLRRKVTNTSGVTGVRFDKNQLKWSANIGNKSMNIHLGTFESFEDAVSARKEAEKKLGYHPRHGETRPL